MAEQGYAAIHMEPPHPDAVNPDASPSALPTLPPPPAFAPPRPTQGPQSYDIAPMALYIAPEPTPLAPGQLTPAWRTLFVAGWLGVMLGFGAVWQSGRASGISPWWLGPATDQRLFVVIALPFVAPTLAVIAAITKLRITCYVGIVAAIATAAIAAIDRPRFPGMAAVEFALAAAGLLISVGALAGRMREPD